MKERLLKVSEVGILLGGIHPNNIYKMAKEGQLPSLRIGKRIRFRESDIIKWINNKTRINQGEGMVSS